ncbi:MAG: hypothetical protein CMJ31_06040 [Phycisphaerae bacterium]|nr:hypothetical protein [Phycisphaerae bacterium]
MGRVSGVALIGRSDLTPNNVRIDPPVSMSAMGVVGFEFTAGVRLHRRAEALDDAVRGWLATARCRSVP